MKHRAVVSNLIFKPASNSSSSSSSSSTSTSPQQDFAALFRRSHHPNLHTYQGHLAPISGSIDATDPSPTAAAARELREETRLIAGKDLRLEFVGSPFSFSDDSNQRSWTVYPFAWTLAADAEARIVIDWEHEGWEWVRPEDILGGKMMEGECVPRLDESLRRVYFGSGGMFKCACFQRSRASGQAFLAGMDRLRNDRENGARVLATDAVRCLIEIVEGFDPAGDSEVKGWRRRRWWEDLKVAAWHLIYSARPSMNAAISSAVLAALEEIRPLATQALRREQVVQKLQSYINQRDAMSGKISAAFGSYVASLLPPRDNHSSPPQLHIITLSSSSTIRAAIVALLHNKQLPNLHINLAVLESRPKCEGASLAAAILKSVDGEQGDEVVRARLGITVAPDSHVAHFVRATTKTPGREGEGNGRGGTASILLLGADRISPSGHVSNKMGSCAAAIVSKTLAPEARVVVLSETDKIAKPSGGEAYEDDRPGAVEEEEEKVGEGLSTRRREMEEHADEENDPDEVTRIWQVAGAGQDVVDILQQGDGVALQNVYFEWVPAEYVDIYVSEDGVLERAQIKAKSLKKKKMEEELLGDLYEDK